MALQKRHFSMNRLALIFFALTPIAVWASPTVPVLVSSSALPPVSNPLLVPSLSVVISGTTGYARDAALEQAARQGLPIVLSGPAFGLNAAEVAPKIKSLGSALPFVTRYTIRNERVLPSYSMVVDMVYNQAMLQKNFGAIHAPAASPTAPISGTEATPAPSAMPQVWLVRVQEPSAAGQDRARRALAALPNTTATLHEITRMGVVLKVTSGTPQNEIVTALAGWNPSIEPYTAQPVAAAPATPSVGAGTPLRAPARPNPAWLPDLW
jgi:hypothetical protein